MKNHVPRYFLNSVPRNNAFRSGFLSILMLSLVLSCKTGGGDPGPDRVEALCRLKFEKAVKSSASAAADGYETTYEVDDQSRLILETTNGIDPNGKGIYTITKQYAYDAEGFLTGSVENYIDPRVKRSGRKITNAFQYNNGRLVVETRTYTFDDPTAENYTSAKEYAYDSQGGLSEKTERSSVGGSAQGETVVTYANGRAVAIKRAGTTYELNAQGFITKQTTEAFGTEMHEYNAKGQRTKSEAFAFDGSRISTNTYEYADVDFKQKPNPIAFKGFSEVPSELGVIASFSKLEGFGIKEAGIFGKFYTHEYTYQLDGMGNLTTKTGTLTSVSTDNTSITKQTFEYDGCK